MYTIDERKFETAEDAAQHVIDNADLVREYNDMLDECYGDICICGFKYAPSEALYRVDKVAYDCGYNDLLGSLYVDVLCELDCMSDGDTLVLYDCEIAYTEEEEDITD